MVSPTTIERRNVLRSLIKQNPRRKPADAITWFGNMHLYETVIGKKEVYSIMKSDFRAIKKDPKELVVLVQCQRLIAQITAIQKVIGKNKR